MPPRGGIAVHGDPAAPTAKRSVFEPLLLPLVQVRLQHPLARQTPTQAPSARQTFTQASVVSQTRIEPAGAPDNARGAQPAPLVELREVRRFVMRTLQSKDKHVCVISAMTYPTDGRRVVVDLVFRDDRGRWSEKAVVRRGTAAMKLIGVKQRPLPYKTVVAQSVVPSP
jgi:hypothetical protein